MFIAAAPADSICSISGMGWPARIWAAVGGGLIALVGLALLGGGGWLIFLNGSPYYLLAGAGVIASGVLLIRRHPAAGFVYAAVLAATLAWAIWESGLVYWSLVPRLVAPAVLGVFLLLVLPATRKTALRGQAAAALARRPDPGADAGDRRRSGSGRQAGRAGDARGAGVAGGPGPPRQPKLMFVNRRGGDFYLPLFFG